MEMWDLKIRCYEAVTKAQEAILRDFQEQLPPEPPKPALESLKLTMAQPLLPASWCCQRCGAHLGYIGRFFDWIGLIPCDCKEDK